MIDNIIPPRAVFTVPDEEENNSERVIVGTKWSGVVLDLTKKGIRINAYYSDTDLIKYAVLTEWASIPWEDVEKARTLIGLSPIKRKIVSSMAEHTIDTAIDDAYLSMLPKVNLNGKMYYLDSNRKERRPVASPEQVFKYDSVLANHKQ
jgi:hypothetical protein